jgi:hypothetical protein
MCHQKYPAIHEHWMASEVVRTLPMLKWMDVRLAIVIRRQYVRPMVSPRCLYICRTTRCVGKLIKSIVHTTATAWYGNLSNGIVHSDKLTMLVCLKPQLVGVHDRLLLTFARYACPCGHPT